jgi:hypothetical protein
MGLFENEGNTMIPHYDFPQNEKIRIKPPYFTMRKLGLKTWMKYNEIAPPQISLEMFCYFNFNFVIAFSSTFFSSRECHPKKKKTDQK